MGRTARVAASLVTGAVALLAVCPVAGSASERGVVVVLSAADGGALAEVMAQEPDQDALAELVRTNRLCLRRFGDVDFVWQGRTMWALDVRDLADGSLAYADSPVGTSGWRCCDGHPWEAGLSDWLNAIAPTDLADLRDGRVVATPRPAWAPGVGDTVRTSLRYREPLVSEWAETFLQVWRSLPGDVPRLPGRVSMALRRLTLRDLVGEVAADAGWQVSVDDGLAAEEVYVRLADVPVDAFLCGLALAAGGEWRALGERSLHLSRYRSPLREVQWVADLHASGPAESLDSGLDAGMLLPTSGSGGALTALLAGGDGLIELCIGGEADTTRVLLCRLDPSRAVLRAFPTPREPLHCASDSILGFAEGRGAPLDKASRDTLVAATENKGDLDGNELIALAKSVGVELVGVKGTLDEIGEKQGIAIVHLDWGHYVAVTDCDSAFVTLRGADGRRARFPKDALESGMSGIMFVSPELLEGDNAGAGEQ